MPTSAHSSGSLLRVSAKAEMVAYTCDAQAATALITQAQDREQLLCPHGCQRICKRITERTLSRLRSEYGGKRIGSESWNRRSSTSSVCRPSVYGAPHAEGDDAEIDSDVADVAQRKGVACRSAQPCAPERPAHRCASSPAYSGECRRRASSSRHPARGCALSARYPGEARQPECKRRGPHRPGVRPGAVTRRNF